MGRFNPEDIDPTLCTHVVYAFATLKNHLLTEGSDKDAEMYRRLIALRDKNADIKVCAKNLYNCIRYFLILTAIDAMRNFQLQEDYWNWIWSLVFCNNIFRFYSRSADGHSARHHLKNLPATPSEWTSLFMRLSISCENTNSTDWTLTGNIQGSIHSKYIFCFIKNVYCNLWLCFYRGADDRAAYVNLLKELRLAFEGEAKSSDQPKLILSAAVPASFEAIAAG